MVSTNPRFEGSERSVVNRVRGTLPDRFSTGKKVETDHWLFKDETRDESVAVMRLETDPDGEYYEVDTFEGGDIIGSETFDDVQGLVEFIEDEY